MTSTRSVQSQRSAARHCRQAVYLRRQAAIALAAERLEHRPAVPESERDAVLAAIDLAYDERAAQLDGRPAS